MKVCHSLLLAMLLLYGTTSPSASQITFERAYGGIYYDSGTGVVETADHGYVVLGTSNSFTNNTNAAYVIRTNARGDTVWTRIIGDSPASGVDLQHASDGGYVLAIASGAVNPAKGYEINLVKIDDAGMILWSKSYGGPSTDYVHAIAATTDGGYALLAHTLSFGSGSSDFYLVRVNQAGDTLWTRTYGGSAWDWGGGVCATKDGGFILVGDTQSFGDSDGDLYLIKTDANGNMQWQRTFGGPDYDRGYQVIQCADDGYLVAGITKSYGAGDSDCYLVRTNANGDSLWTKTFGGINGDAAQTVRRTTDGNFVFVGGTSGMGAGKSDAWLVKIDPSGNMLWNRLFGGAEFDWGFDVVETAEGGFAFVGSSESFVAGNDDDVYLVKTDGSGNLTDVRDEMDRRPESHILHQNYPNPFRPGTHIQYDLDGQSHVVLKIFDLMGREVRTLVDAFKPAGVFHAFWDGKDESGRRVAGGVYLYSLAAGGTILQTRKLVIAQ